MTPRTWSGAPPGAHDDPAYYISESSSSSSDGLEDYLPRHLRRVRFSPTDTVSYYDDDDDRATDDAFGDAGGGDRAREAFFESDGDEEDDEAFVDDGGVRDALAETEKNCAAAEAAAEYAEGLAAETAYAMEATLALAQKRLDEAGVQLFQVEETLRAEREAHRLEKKELLEEIVRAREEALAAVRLAAAKPPTPTASLPVNLQRAPPPPAATNHKAVAERDLDDAIARLSLLQWLDDPAWGDLRPRDGVRPAAPGTSHAPPPTERYAAARPRIPDSPSRHLDSLVQEVKRCASSLAHHSRPAADARLGFEVAEAQG